MEILKTAHLPAGEMNTALALKARRNGYQPILWFHREESYQHFQETNESPALKGFNLLDIQGTSSRCEALEGAELVSFVPRSWDFRQVVRDAKPYIDENAILLTATKGFDEFEGEYYTPSQIIEQEIPESRNRIAVLSGPNFAKEIAQGKITGTTVAAYDQEVAQRVRRVFHSREFRVDVRKKIKPIEVEVIGAYKNVVGLIMGFARTMPEYGEDTGALILQKGLSEAALLAEAMGGDPQAIMELCGVGDYGMLMNSFTSRNVQAGYQYGMHEATIEELMNSNTTYEGIPTTKAIRALAQKYRVPMLLAICVYRVIYKNSDPAYAVRRILRNGQD